MPDLPRPRLPKLGSQVVSASATTQKARAIVLARDATLKIFLSREGDLA